MKSSAAPRLAGPQAKAPARKMEREVVGGCRPPTPHSQKISSKPLRFTRVKCQPTWIGREDRLQGAYGDCCVCGLGRSIHHFMSPPPRL